MGKQTHRQIDPFLQSYGKCHSWFNQTAEPRRVPSGRSCCMESWTTASRHITSQVRTWTQTASSAASHSLKVTSASPYINPPEHTDSEENTTNGTYFVSRWEVLQSLLRVPKFICIHLSWQSKTWPLITAWLLCKGAEDTGGRFTHLTSLRRSSRG